MRGKHCLVLGAGGFIGTNLCRALLVQGAVVTGYGRRQAFPGALGGVIWNQADFADRVALARAIEGQDVIFHLIAGSVPESSNRDPLADLLDGPAATLRLLDLCREARPGGSSSPPPAAPSTASRRGADRRGRGHRSISAYGVSRLAIEKYLNLYRSLHGVPSVVLRVANAYGPYQDPNRRQGVVAALLSRALAGETLEVWGSGDVVRDFVHVDDVVAALIAAASYGGAAPVLNVGSGIGRSVADIVRDIGAVAGMGAIRAVHRPARPVDVPVNVLDISLVRRELGWAPAVPWLEGLRRTAAWFFANSNAG